MMDNVNVAFPLNPWEIKLILRLRQLHKSGAEMALIDLRALELAKIDQREKLEKISESCVREINRV